MAICYKQYYPLISLALAILIFDLKHKLKWSNRSEKLQKTIKNFNQAPVAQLSKLENLFIELSYKACNLKCRHCFIEKAPYKQENDFIEIEKIKKAFLGIREHNIKSIYLTGGEPLMHNDFNQILRLCLTITNVTILTNGTLINEKKARFLKKIDDESKFETIYRISLEHWQEDKNDTMRGRGSYRKALWAISNLAKYGFNPIVTTINFYNEPKEALYQGFGEMFRRAGIEFGDINLKIMPHFKKDLIVDTTCAGTDVNKVDCINSRILTKKGVFSCPILSGDFRARSGSDLASFSQKVVLDTELCQTCLAHGKKAFANDWM